MPSSRRPARRQRHARIAVAIGAALVAALFDVAPGEAQFSVGAPQADRNAPVLFQADEVEYDEQLGLTVAKGNVEISQGGEVLLADTVSYNQRTGTITASGNVSLVQPTGEVVFSEFIELRDSMNTGFAQNVRMLLADRSRVAANAARRLGGNRTELTRGVYSPCDLCPGNPSAPPAWQFKAREIVHDQALKLLEFRDAVLELDGWPVFYTPYISAPDPTVKRASGFLMPGFGRSSNNGFSFSLPYYWAIDVDKDLTLAPRFTTKGGQLLATEYRQRFGNGALDATGSINYSDAKSATDTQASDRWRGHINASGVWHLSETYRTGFDLQRVSDQTYLLRYGFGVPLLNAMISRAYLQGFEPRAMTDVFAYAFQPLLPGLGSATQPIVLPVANRTWISEPDPLGGRWFLNGNLLNIIRETGTQTRRASLGSRWERIFRDGIGGQYAFSASLRGDAYSVSNLSRISNPDLPSAYFPLDGAPASEPIDRNFVAARAFPQLGLTWSYPLAHRGPERTAIIEPIAGAYVGPAGGNRRRIPNEDSLGFELRDVDLFQPDRLAGYDLLDTGQRVDYGLRLGLYDRNGGNYRMLVGQSYRAQPNPFLPPGSGAAERLSDVVGRFVASPSSYLDLIYRFRLDKSSLRRKTQEIGLSAGPQNLRVGANFLYAPAQQLDEIVTDPVTSETILYGKREQLSFNIKTQLTRYWALAGSQTLNLTDSTNLINGVPQPQSAGVSIYATLAAIYQDECMAFIGSVTQSGIRNGDVTPGVSVMFNVVFKNLGEIGGTLLSLPAGLL
ncbi:MAG TPA: LPS assembly protein LptD [Stellaceae bacterium]|nr:LPS assembly protein LptD [Stellaceae bacterium]